MELCQRSDPDRRQSERDGFTGEYQPAGFGCGWNRTQFSLALRQPVWNDLYPGSLGTIPGGYSLPGRTGPDPPGPALGHRGALPMTNERKAQSAVWGLLSILV